MAFASPTRRIHMHVTHRRGAASGNAVFCSLAAVLLYCATLFGTAPVHAQTEIKLGHVGEPGSLFQVSADEFAKRANAKLAGKAKVTVFGSSQLGGDKE